MNLQILIRPTRGLVALFVSLVFAASPASAQYWVKHRVTTDLTYMSCIAASSDCTKLVVGGGISSDSSGTGLGYLYTSADSGVTWQRTAAPASSNGWDVVVSSADGTRLAAVTGGAIYVSSDSGKTWTQSVLPLVHSAPSFIFPSPVNGLASSADGLKLVTLGACASCDHPDGIYHSSDAGLTWSVAYTPGATNGWGTVVSSADGLHLAALGADDFTHERVIYFSADFGATWQRSSAPSKYASLLAMSSAGSKLVATDTSPGAIYTSADYGASWTLRSGAPSQLWSALASSADGTRLVAGALYNHGGLYVSSNSGLTWSSPNTPTVTVGTNKFGLGWTGIACSADGLKLAALPTYYADSVYTVTLGGLSATISATPSRVDLEDQIQVTVTVQNATTNTLTNVKVNDSITVSGSGGVAFTGISGPSVLPTLAPNADATLTYLYEATNYGIVNFSAVVIGQGPSGPVYTPPATSDKVAILPKCDLMIKTLDPKDTTFAGVDEYQQSPSGDQSLRLSVGTNGVAGCVVRVQNNSRGPHSFVLRSRTNSYPNWVIQVLANNANILGALTGADGWATPSLDPGASLDLQVSLSPAAQVGLLEVQSVLLGAFVDSTDNNVLDTVLLRVQLVQVPVQMTIEMLDATGLTAESIQAGQTDINAPLVPVSDPDILERQPSVFGGLVADGVTPLVIRLFAESKSLAPFPQGLKLSIQANTLGVGALNGAPISDRFQALKDGAWQPLPPSSYVVLTMAANVAYVELLPIRSDDLLFGGLTNQLGVDFSVVENASGVQCGDTQFTIRKPPIALLHGYNTAGEWGDDFQAILGTSRPYLPDDQDNNFVVTVRYGQDLIPTPGLPSLVGLPVYDNTLAPLTNCAQKALEALNQAMARLHNEWAFTRFDVVAHSQGGVLTRMLCNGVANDSISQPFRNADNFNRGRFHRVVTIGSPHNGSRLLRYLLDLNDYGKLAAWSSVPLLVGLGGVQSTVAQGKFDPWGPQIADVNNPSPTGPWQPDPDASFHLVRTVIDNGAGPGVSDSTPSYILLGLNNPIGGPAVIPRGSDGVVDFDSMAANVPPAPVAANVFTLPSANDVSHSGPEAVFASTSYQTVSPDVAQHVIGALDQVLSLPAGDIVFGSFAVPPLLSSAAQAQIDNYAAGVTAVALARLVTLLPRALDDQIGRRYELTFPTNFPPVGNVAWAVQVYGPSGITTDGVEVSESGTNNNQVTVTVDSGLVGDVVLSAVYASASNTWIVSPPTLVASLPSSGPAMTGFQVWPARIALPVGSVVSPLLRATYSDGSSSFRYAGSNALQVTSSQPAAVSVTDPLNWKLSSVGTAQITVAWAGFRAQSQITVFDLASTNAPTLALVDAGNGQLTASWPGYTTSYQLESSGDLSAANSWQAVPTIPIRAGGESYVMLSATNAQQFYRLRWQR
jgi:hypothetical protein